MAVPGRKTPGPPQLPPHSPAPGPGQPCCPLLPLSTRRAQTLPPAHLHAVLQGLVCHPQQHRAARQQPGAPKSLRPAGARPWAGGRGARAEEMQQSLWEQKQDMSQGSGGPLGWDHGSPRAWGQAAGGMGQRLAGPRGPEAPPQLCQHRGLRPWASSLPSLGLHVLSHQCRQHSPHAE